jgi:MFS family permease
LTVPFNCFFKSVGTIHGALSLIGQLPTNYSDSEIGYAASLITFCGLLGSFFCGFLLDYTKAYRTIYKVANVCAFFSLVFFVSNATDNRYALFMIAGCLYGFCVIPSYPATICCAVECCYPVPEEATVGKKCFYFLFLFFV